MALDKDTERLLRSMASQLEEYADADHSEHHSFRDGTTSKVCTEMACKDTWNDIKKARAMLTLEEPSTPSAIIRWHDAEADRWRYAVRANEDVWDVTSYAMPLTWAGVVGLARVRDGHVIWLLDFKRCVWSPIE